MTSASPSRNPARFGKAAGLLDEGARGKAYGAAVLLAAKRGEIAIHAAAGGASLSSVFDIASLTKPMTAFLFFSLVQEGRMSLDGRLADVLSMRTGDSAAGRITFRHLLCHTSGLPAYVPFYAAVRDAETKSGKRLWGGSEGHDMVIEAARSLATESAPGSRCVYSDPGYMLLGRAIEIAAFEPLSRLLGSRIASPLMMRDTSFLPLSVMSECETGRIVSTGYSEDRGREKIGEADDENASAMGGVAGHAGIFSTAYDLFLFAREILRARAGEGRVLGRQAALTMTSRAPEPPGCPRTPGWDTPTPAGGKASQAGGHFTEGSFGHLGFTGCSLWADPSRDAVVVLLTNRVFYGKQNGGLKTLRPLIHDAVMEELGN